MKINEAVRELADVTVHASGTFTQGVKGPGVELRPWIAHFPVCPALTQHQLAHVGIMRTTAPTRIVRTKQTTTYFLACFGGRGKVLIDGRWRCCRAGFASLLPAHTLNAFEALPGVKWEFCWACYQQPLRPVADVSSPVMARYDARSLHSAITGLTHECHTAAEPTMVQHWADLIHDYVRRFAQPFQEDDRLRTLWERVVRQLGDAWSLGRLAHEAGYSNEHLRRLCRRQLGRSPMHQVTYLRMRRAAELLASTSQTQTIEAIAEQVGYHNPFVFSNAFTKWIGWRPSQYRRTKLRFAPQRSAAAHAI